ncbi:hypothetical protein [Sediminibacterium sp.]|jgi:hypothetical protein|uniref:hypothetical protein n=1 Tax=Sediminibacterium sp. TaxID=1917865 RepID=UPI000BCC59CF|nr:hypothetical protein [Sediminibacterium sp.]MDP3394130.1 hypothetical protein [Sediminibacterium sp.]MDP3566281.1 hypothetical protein [Sediminibacterium sp.]OYZ02670.1 MAG: hypothetical protein B7Y37_02485 [Sphingobacteriia bacterium 28-36-52]
MKHSQTIGFIAVVLAILVCFMPWVFIESKNLTITGFKAEGTRFGRPGMFIVYMGSIAAVLFLIPKIWAKRVNVFLTAMVFAWAVRNYLLLTTCSAGECPKKQIGLFLLLAFSAIIMIMSFLPKIDLSKQQQ